MTIFPTYVIFRKRFLRKASLPLLYCGAVILFEVIRNYTHPEGPVIIITSLFILYVTLYSFFYCRVYLKSVTINIERNTIEFTLVKFDKPYQILLKIDKTLVIEIEERIIKNCSLAIYKDNNMIIAQRETNEWERKFFMEIIEDVNRLQSKALVDSSDFPKN